MTECYIQHENEKAACQCGNCGSEFIAGRLDMICDIQERIMPGGTVPAGECPDCGALAYLVEAPDWSDAAARQKAEARAERLSALVYQIARMTPCSIDSSDDNLEDCVATINSLISAARDLNQVEG